MNKSAIFTKAHSIAKSTVSYVGNYSVAFSLALKSVYASLKSIVPGVITALNDGFVLVSRGHKMTLTYDAKFSWWEMHTDNASTRAYRSLGVKIFNSLGEVERAYKSWRGVSLLLDGTTAHVN